MIDVVLKRTVNLGICTGERSPVHPNRDVVEVLEANTGRLTWARTDRNRLSTFASTPTGVEVSPGIGAVNDATPNP